MSEGQGINVPITADVSGLTSGASEALKSIQAFTGGVNGAFSGLASAVNVVKGPFMALSGLLAGGALFKGAIDGAKNWNLEVQRLSRAMSLSLEDASAYKKAMDDLDISTDQMAGVSRMLTMRMQQGGKAFREAGIELVAMGKMRTTSEVFAEIAKKWKDLGTEGEKNALLFKTLGRSYQSYIPTLKLTADKIAAAKDEVKAFGMVVTEEGIARTNAYKVAMNNMGDAFTALKVNLGNELMPIFTDIAKEFAKAGDETFPMLKRGVYGIVTAIDFLILSLRVIWEVIKQTWEYFKAFGEGLGAVGAAIALAFEGKFAEAGEALKLGVQDWGKTTTDATRSATDNISRMWSDLEKRELARMARMNGTAKEQRAKPPPGGGTGLGTDMSGSIKEDAKDAHAAAVRRANRKLTLDEEVAFWRSWTAEAAAGGALYKKAWEEWSLKMVDLMAQVRERKMKEGQDAIDIETAYGDQSFAARFAAEDRKYQMLVAGGAEFAEQAKAQYQKLLSMNAQFIAEDKKLDEQALGWAREAAEARMNLEDQAIQWAGAQGIIGDEERLAREAEMIERRFALKRDELDRLAAMYAEDSARLAQIYQQMEMLKIEHEGRMTQIGQQAFEAQKRQVEQFTGPVKDAFAEMFEGIKQGGMDMGRIMRGLFVNLARMVLTNLTSMVTQSIALGATETTAKVAQATTQTTANATVAASGAAGAVASTPFAGPALAAAAFSTIMALVMGSLSLLSASGGYDLGSESPITQLHAREMVLPAHLAERIRNMTDGGGGGGNQGPQNVTVNFALSGMDGPSVYRTFKENEAQIVKALTEAANNGRLRLGS